MHVHGFRQKKVQLIWSNTLPTYLANINIYMREELYDIDFYVCYLYMYLLSVSLCVEFEVESLVRVAPTFLKNITNERFFFERLKTKIELTSVSFLFCLLIG